MFTGSKKYKMQGKTKSHMNSVIKSQVIELVRSKRIKTTPSKAKILKAKFDRLVTHAKKDTQSSKNQVQSFFGTNTRAKDRFYEVVKAELGDRNSGYTRVFKTLPRRGDNAEQSYIMLSNYEAVEKKSKIQKLLEKREAKESSKGVANKVKNVVQRKSEPKKAATKIITKEKTAKTRRNSK